MSQKAPARSQGVRRLTFEEQAPACEIFINQRIYHLDEVCKNKRVVDIGCGYGANKKLVESVGGTWVGVEPFEGGAHTVVGKAEALPFENESFDVAIMDSVLEHVEDAGKAFQEVARILVKGGKFVGYAAFMECFHEISYNHLSFRALEYYAQVNGMKLMRIGGGRAFGIDYHLQVIFYPLPTKLLRKVVAWKIRNTFRLKSKLMYLVFRYRQKQTRARAKEMSKLYFQVECLRQSNGFQFVIEKMN